MEEFGESKISKLFNHVKDNVMKEVADILFESFDLKLKKLMANNNFSDMDKNLTNKDIKDMIFFDNYPKNIFKDYLEVFLYSKVEVLEVIDDNEIKFEEKECVKEL